MGKNQKTALITGITGQDGPYLAEFLLGKGYKVYGLERRNSQKNRDNIKHLLDKDQGIQLVSGDLMDEASLVHALKGTQPDEVYNLASQSFVPESWKQPVYTSHVTGLGAVRMLEAIRQTDPLIKFYQASSSEMFGGAKETPQHEKTEFYPRSPYGAAKLFAHWMTVNYRESYNMFAVSGILFNHESPRRGMEFVTRKITHTAAKIKLGLAKELRLGNMDAERDWGYAGDYVEAMWRMLQQETPKDYVIATGESHSIKEFVEEVFNYLDLDWKEHVVVDTALFRPAEVVHLRGDATLAKKELEWSPKVNFKQLVRMMVDADMQALRNIHDERDNRSHFEISTCRSCGFGNLTSILSLGSLHVSNFVDGGAEEKGKKTPLELVLCDVASGGCGLAQLKHTASATMMYRNYWYRSGVNKTMTKELADIARTAESIVELLPGDIVVDIGSNDSTLLRSYTARKVTRVGFEPAANLMDYATEGTERIFNDFFAHAPFRREFGDKKAKIITAIAMFYDLDEPNAFVQDIKRTLASDGVFIIQMTDALSMLTLNAFDNICHEHLEYYSLASLEYLLNRYGLEVFDLTTNNINGGSLRVYVRHKGNAVGKDEVGGKKRRRERLDLEQKLEIHKISPYQRFAERVREIEKQLVGFIKQEKAKGKRIYVYGASTKGNTLLQFFNLDHTIIDAAAERNPIKWGKKTVGTNIPIISEERAREEKPDYFLILPWHFLDEFVEREEAYLKAGGKFIVPLPEFKVIGAEYFSK